MLRTALSLIAVMKELSVSGQESEERATGHISWWESVIDYSTTMKRQMNYSISSWG